MGRLLDRYKQEIAPELMRTLDIKNPMAVPRLEKVVVSMGTGSPMVDKNRLAAVAGDLGRITGQKPQVRPLVVRYRTSRPVAAMRLAVA